MKSFKKFISLMLAAAVITCSSLSLSACGDSDKNKETSAATEVDMEKDYENGDGLSPALEDLADLGIDVKALGLSPKITYAEDEEYGFQLESPEKGDAIAVLHTSEGDIKMRLFPEYAPKTVENFIALAKDGKYDGVIFHRVIDDFMIQTGDYENSDGTGGKSSDGGQFEDEFCDKLLNLRGSVAMANSGADTNGSQFFINQQDAEAMKENGGWAASKTNWSDFKSQLKSYADDASTVAQLLNYYYTSCYDADIVPEEVQKLYDSNGGNPGLDGAYNAGDRGHTVFGQVIEGMDVVDEIADADTDSNNKPEKDITIKSVEITEYK